MRLKIFTFGENGAGALPVSSSNYRFFLLLMPFAVKDSAFRNFACDIGCELVEFVLSLLIHGSLFYPY